MERKIAILGSTGSIGTQTLEIVRRNGDIRVTALAAGRNIKRLEEQIREFLPELACVWDEEKAKELRVKVRDLPVKIVSGMDGLIEAALEPSAEIVVTAVVGMIGIRPTIAAMEAGKDIALANKETLVTAGHLIMDLARRKGVRILPVDSEHSAIFQCLHGERSDRLYGGWTDDGSLSRAGQDEGQTAKNKPGNAGQDEGQTAGNKIAKILLTASGGPFRGWTKEQLINVQLEDALKHPNWAMGQKITIDSSTMVNKGLEVMEARWLFDVGFDQIQVVVQPQSIIHSMVEFEDGAVMAQLGTPDMKLPIQYALYYPKRRFLAGDRLDFEKLQEIRFEKPDMETFRGLALAYQAGREGGTVPTVFNAANEAAVRLFLQRKISYLQIVELIEKAMERHKKAENPSVERILEAEAEAEEFVMQAASGMR